MPATHPPGKRRRTTLAFILALGLMTPAVSAACSFRPQKMSPAEVRHYARWAFRKAGAVVDAEVTAPMRFDGEQPGLIPVAILRVIKVWKGHVQGNVAPVVYMMSCDIALERKGQHVRILLTGDEVFHADQGINGAPISNLSIYNDEIDRLVGHRRPANYAHFPGEEALPPLPKGKGRG